MTWFKFWLLTQIASHLFGIILTLIVVVILLDATVGYRIRLKREKKSCSTVKEK